MKEDGNQLLEFTFKVINKTDNAILFSNDENNFWIPNSCISLYEDEVYFNSNSLVIGTNITIYIKRWICHKIGLI